MSSRSSLGSLQEVLDDAAAKGTQNSELCHRLAHRLRQAHAWSVRATKLLSASHAPAQPNAHFQQAYSIPQQATPAAASPAAAMGMQTGLPDQQQQPVAAQQTPGIGDAADARQHVGADSRTTAMTAAASDGPATMGPPQPSAQPGMQPSQEGATATPAGKLQPRAAAPPHEATGRALSARPSLPELEALVTEGNLLGVKLDALNDANAALSSVRAWLKQVSILSTPAWWLSEDDCCVQSPGSSLAFTEPQLMEKRSRLMPVQASSCCSSEL